MRPWRHRAHAFEWIYTPLNEDDSMTVRVVNKYIYIELYPRRYGGDGNNNSGWEILKKRPRRRRFELKN